MDKRKLILVIILLASLVAVAACGPLKDAYSGLATEAAATNVPGDTTPLPAVTRPAPAAAPSLAPTSNAPPSVVAAIQSVIVKANQEQQQAIAKQDPTTMRDTSTASYYNEAAQNVNDMLSSGVTAIKLTDLNWGPVTQQSSTMAQATTVETWSTSFSDGSTLQETDTNVYTLVLQGASWKVQQDDHPDSRTLQPPGSNPGGATGPATRTAPPAPAGPGQSQSRNWAGYATTGGKFTAVSGTWTVPNVSPQTTGMDATWVGIGGVSARDLIQAGTQAIVQAGQVTYSAWVETLPQAAVPIPMTVSAGDSISVSITEQSGSNWLIVIKDATNTQTYQTTLTYTSSNSSAEWVEEAPATGHRVILPLDRFGSITFTNATTIENGQPRTIAQSGAKSISMYSSAQQALAQPSALAANGTSFTVTRTNVTAPLLGPGGRGLGGSRRNLP